MPNAVDGGVWSGLNCSIIIMVAHADFCALYGVQVDKRDRRGYVKYLC